MVGFDEGLLNYGNGASEDCDMGMQIFRASGLGIYSKKIKAWHKDPTSIISYYKKIFFTLKNHLIYEQKWSDVRKTIFTKRTLAQKWMLYLGFCKKYKINLLMTLIVFFHISLTFILIKAGRFFLKFNISNLNVVKI